MSQSMGTLDFFLLESSEYVERLDALAQTPAGPFAGGEEFVRFARAFRGSALMASQHGMARAAQGLESVARAVRESRLEWDERVRAEVTRAVDDCKVLMHRLREPDPGDQERAEAIGSGLDRLSGRSSAERRAASTGALDAGGRAFVAREAAAIASVLQRTAVALASDPSSRDVLAGVSPGMSALRGVAALADLPPLADLLAGIESAVKEVSATPGAVGAGVADVFDTAARAMARAAREVVDAGRPAAESEEAGAFATKLLATFTGNVVPIEALFYADAGPHVVSRGAAPAGLAGAGLGRMEMVSHGEFLRAATTELQRATSWVQRDLRLYVIAASLRPMSGSVGSLVSTSLGRFADATRDAIGRGAGAGALPGFVDLVGRAADTLSAAQISDESQLAEQLDDVTRGLAALHTAPVAAVPPTEPVAAAAPEPITTAPAPAPAASPEQGADLATAYATFDRLVAERGLQPGSLDEFLAGGAGVAAAAPVEVAVPVRRPVAPTRKLRSVQAGVALREDAVVPIESLAPAEEAVVPIESLLYGRDRALARILELKPDLDAASSAGGDGARLTALLNEVFDLVELGLGAGR
ncbi:MAG: hypothetical protein Q7J79_00355 [Gemmatimonadales bacterium]|nr:hypothetical protein [Gemmatimonadales bacterium]